MAVSFVTAGATARFNLTEKRNGLSLAREVIAGFEPTDEVLKASGTSGIKGRRKSKKDKLREVAARKAPDPES